MKKLLSIILSIIVLATSTGNNLCFAQNENSDCCIVGSTFSHNRFQNDDGFVENKFFSLINALMKKGVNAAGITIDYFFKVIYRILDSGFTQVCKTPKWLAWVVTGYENNNKNNSLKNIKSSFEEFKSSVTDSHENVINEAEFLKWLNSDSNLKFLNELQRKLNYQKSLN